MCRMSETETPWLKGADVNAPLKECVEKISVSIPASCSRYLTHLAKVDMDHSQPAVCLKGCIKPIFQGSPALNMLFK